MEPLVVTRRAELGDEGTDVLALKQRLRALGYSFTNMDDVFDGRMFDAVSDFQTRQGLFVYGVADYTTQELIETASKYAKEIIDLQMDKALELIYNM